MRWCSMRHGFLSNYFSLKKIRRHRCHQNGEAGAAAAVTAAADAVPHETLTN